ncbi:hypothetical protein [Gilvimarinus chinensis]|uniref:hypothetical protein n=1 Tax=Gilvimarinus chinensis TaxID=396005 RepID=UPI00035D860E|nr:hypothetical protein [Gilvimarinus chinensis]
MLCYRYDDHTNQALALMLSDLHRHESSLHSALKQAHLEPSCFEQAILSDPTRTSLLSEIANCVSLATKIMFDPVSSENVLIQHSDFRP